MVENVEIFPWNVNFETGIPLIDEQHKKLVELLNALVGHLAFQSDAPTIDRVFDELKDYVAYHFASEEGIWQTHFEGDAWAKWHAQSHGDFIAEVTRLKGSDDDLPYDETIERIVRFLTHWLAHHILDSDRRMAKVVLALPSGVSLARAKELANDEMSGATRVLIDTIMAMYDNLAASTVMMSREIYRRQQAEAELQTANRAKTRFLANMSHELRTPLNSILGFADILRRDPGFSESQQEILAIIRKSGDHLLDLINGALDIAKIEADHITLEPVPFDLERMIGDVIGMLRVRAWEKDLQLLVERSPDFPCCIVGDEAKLRQILINLISNAITATERGSVTLCLGVEGGRLLLEVTDTGIGIAAEDQAKVFEPFVQLDATARRRGTGLGLAITRQFTELMGGSLTLASSPGQGSCFRVDLPWLPARPEEVAVPAKQGEVIGLQSGQAAFRVLVAEDQEENRLLLARLLENVGFAVYCAANGAEAVEQFLQHRPHFVWMDRRMPVLDGDEAVRRIRALPGGNETKLVTVTASTFKEEIPHLLACGFDAIIFKPFRSEQIFDCMERLLGVQFVHAREDSQTEALPEVTPSEMAGLPAAQREKLEQALLTLNNEQIADAICHIGRSAPELASALGCLARTYQHEAIWKLLETARNRDDTNAAGTSR